MSGDDRIERLEAWRKELRALQRETLDACAVRERSRYKMLKPRREIAALEPIAKADEDKANALVTRLEVMYEHGRKNGFGQ